MKKITSIAIGLMFLPLAVSAQTFTPSQQSVLDTLKQDLIALLTQEIALLQDQINQLLASQQIQQTQIQALTPAPSSTSVSTSTTTPTNPILMGAVTPDVSVLESNSSSNGVTFTVIPNKSDIFFGTDASSNPSLDSGSITITKDGQPFASSAITADIAIPKAGVIKQNDGFTVQQQVSQVIPVVLTINNAQLLAGKYVATLNYVYYYANGVKTQLPVSVAYSWTK